MLSKSKNFKKLFSFNKIESEKTHKRHLTHVICDFKSQFSTYMTNDFYSLYQYLFDSKKAWLITYLMECLSYGANWDWISLEIGFENLKGKIRVLARFWFEIWIWIYPTEKLTECSDPKKVDEDVTSSGSHSTLAGFPGSASWAPRAASATARRILSESEKNSDTRKK